MSLGLLRAKVLGELSMQLVSSISNLCDHNPPMSQTDGWTDDMQSQYRALHCSASRGKNELFLQLSPSLTSACRQYCYQNPYDVRYAFMCAETEEGFVKVRSQRPVMIDQTVRRDVDLDDVVQPSAMVTRFAQLKHLVKVSCLWYEFIYLFSYSIGSDFHPFHCCSVGIILDFYIALGF